MTELSTFVISDRSHRQGQNNEQLVIINPRNNLVLPFIPTTFSFAVTFGVIGLSYGNEQKLNFKLLSPTGKIVADTGDVPFNTVQSDPNLPIEGNGFIMNFELGNVPFFEEGNHKAIISVNGEVLGEKSVFVYNKQLNTGNHA